MTMLVSYYFIPLSLSVFQCNMRVYTRILHLTASLPFERLGVGHGNGNISKRFTLGSFFLYITPLL